MVQKGYNMQHAKLWSQMSQLERYEHEVILTLDRLQIIRKDYDWFKRQGESLRKLYEDDCNGVISEEMLDVQTSFLYNQINTKVSELELFVYYQSDPRGSTIYLDRNPIPENNYNQACCIY